MQKQSIWQWVVEEPFSSPRMEPLGFQEVLEHHNLSMESPTNNDDPKKNLSWKNCHTHLKTDL